MRNKLNCFIIVFCILPLACKRNKQQQNSFEFKPPKVIEAKTYRVPLEKMAAPKVVPVSCIKKTVAGKPETVQLVSNVFPAKAHRVIPAGAPKLLIPRGGSFESPRVVPAIDSPFAAGPPEIVVLRDIYIKENNPGSFSTIKAMHGLKSNEISSLYQDRRGNLWIGAWWGGVSKYDGRSLTNYSTPQGLSSDVVNSIFEDRSGNIWIATVNAGVNKFDGRHITHYSTLEGLSDNFVVNIMQDKNGNIWFATNNGLNRYDGHSFTHYTTAQGLPTNRIRGMLEDSKGNLWFGTHGGLTRFDGHSFQNYTSALDINDYTEVVTILEESNGDLWFGTNIGLFKYDGQYISHYTTKSGLSSNRISKIMEDNNRNLWLGTFDGGANRYDGKSFTHFGADQGLSNDVVTTVLQDKCGNIWLATTAGVCKYDGKLFSHILPLRQEEIECVLADKAGNIWIGSGAGSCFNKYNGSTIARYTTAQGIIDTRINQMIEDKYGNIWFGTRSGVDKYDGHSFRHFSTENGLIDNLVYCLLADKKGNLWFGTEKGLSRYDGKSFTNYSVAQGLSGETIYSILEDHHGTLWIGTSDMGLCTFDGVSFVHYEVTHSLSNAMVIGMIEDKNNNLWFCTSMGVNKFDGKYFSWYTTEQGLSNNIAKNILEDKNGNIWVGTINGINRFIPHANSSDTLKNEGPSFFKKYTVSEGFSGGGTYENSLTQSSNGQIWVGANDRLTSYHPEGEIPDTIPPAIQLSGISLFDENINWPEVEKKKDNEVILKNDKRLMNLHFSGLSPWYNQPEHLQLNHNDNYIRFQFIGISTNRPKEVRYQYILEGLEENWSSITDQTTASYNNLPHGKFIFKVKAVNSEGYWSNELKYSFVILPPWWHTWWAYVLYVSGLAIIIWMYAWYRSRWLKAENRILEEKVNKRTNELEESLEERYRLNKKIESQQALLNERLRISRELHDDIGSTLGSISIYSEVAKKRTEKNENTAEVLSKIGFASRELIDKMSDIVWSLNPNNENFEQLQNRMLAFAAMILTPRNILYDFVTDEELKKMPLTSEQSKNIFLIFKEALYNMVKYANCKNASIVLRLQKNDLTMIIQDDGKGFDVSGKKAYEIVSDGEYVGGNGIKN
ncbi:MAG TPA: two-component regulator propeller domain-containing protein, partial [Puia sp.]|nr:two-component regulator propeller domain-containing protein [Puia sp.]